MSRSRSVKLGDAKAILVGAIVPCVGGLILWFTKKGNAARAVEERR